MAEEFLPLSYAEEDNDRAWYTSAAAGIASGILKVPGTVPDKFVVHSEVSTTEASKPVTAIKGPVISAVPSIITAPFCPNAKF